MRHNQGKGLRTKGYVCPRANSARCFLPFLREHVEQSDAIHTAAHRHHVPARWQIHIHTYILLLAAAMSSHE
jgi:hypothetical protein